MSIDVRLHQATHVTDVRFPETLLNAASNPTPIPNVGSTRTGAMLVIVAALWVFLILERVFLSLRPASLDFHNF